MDCDECNRPLNKDTHCLNCMRCYDWGIPQAHLCIQSETVNYTATEAPELLKPKRDPWYIGPLLFLAIAFVAYPLVDWWTSAIARVLKAIFG